ncbi:hypothetical protein FQR65_LT20863 [Abscondita terminalis]|nr:hypothetical protein FQR65_LT20863 [Abscondita terminalis]
MSEPSRNAGRKEFPARRQGTWRGLGRKPCGALEKVGNDEVRARRASPRRVGAITKSDVTPRPRLRARGRSASRACPQGRRARRPTGPASRSATTTSSNNLMDDVKDAMSGLLAPGPCARPCSATRHPQILHVSKVGKMRLPRQRTDIERGPMSALFLDNVWFTKASSAAQALQGRFQGSRAGQECGCPSRTIRTCAPADASWPGTCPGHFDEKARSAPDHLETVGSLTCRTFGPGSIPEKREPWQNLQKATGPPTALRVGEQLIRHALAEDVARGDIHDGRAGQARHHRAGGAPLAGYSSSRPA